MLNLTRKKGESLVIEIGGETVTLIIKDIACGSSKKQVQIGVEAPKQFKVWRNEIYQSIIENKSAAMSVAPDKLKTFLKHD